ncbi:uncharacterized protein [Cherax quadricarinatus]
MEPKAKFLRLSRDGCPPGINTTMSVPLNFTALPSTVFSTAAVSSTAISSTTVSSTDVSSTAVPPTAKIHPLYGLSYCLNSLWGTLFCIVVAVIVTIVTGSNSPEDVDKKLIAPQSWVLFQKPLITQGKEFFYRTIICRRSSVEDENDLRADESEVKDSLHKDDDINNRMAV